MKECERKTYGIGLEKNNGCDSVIFWNIYWCLFCLVGILFAQLGVADEIPGMITLFVLIVGTLCTFVWVLKKEPDGMAASIILCGYIVRTVYRYGTDKGFFVLAYTSASSDAEHFWITSSNLYFSKPNDLILTKYPYLLRWLYEVFGNNRFLAEYVNILFWVMSSILLIKLGKTAGLSGIKKYILYGIWVILPSSILVGTELLRENIMVFFDMWSFYVFLEWMKSEKMHQLFVAFLIVAPAAYLHTASIALWVAYIVLTAFWNAGKQKYEWRPRTVTLLTIGVIGFGIILFSPLRGVLGTYLGDLSLYGITHRPYEIGGSDYLQWIDCKNWLQFIPYTILKVFYFLFSPLPNEARGLVDLVSFVTDGLLVFLLITYMLYRMKDKNAKGVIFAALVCILSLSGIFAWGVRNAGTAIRHRMLVWGILIMGSCVAMGRRSNNE